MRTNISTLCDSGVKIQARHFTPSPGSNLEFVDVEIRSDDGVAAIQLERSHAEALYFALSQALFDGDLSDKPLQERDNTKPADLDEYPGCTCANRYAAAKHQHEDGCPLANDGILEIVEGDSPIR